MYAYLLALHSLLRWIILLFLLIAIVRHLSGMNKKALVNNTDRRVDLILMTIAHITFLVGLYQWIRGPWGLKLIQNIGMKPVMENDTYRFFAIEHMTGMLIAIILITIGRGKVKRAVDWKAHKKAFWLFLIALIIILASVPWPFRDAVARPWFRGI
jgi:hypothetical protein